MRVMNDRVAAENDVAEETAAKMRVGAITQPIPSSAPSSSAWPGECGPAPMTSWRRWRSVDGPDYIRDPSRRASVQAAAAMDIVGGDADRPRV